MTTCDASPVDKRDRPLLLPGFAAALRRSELVGVQREYLTFTPDGLRLLIPSTKGDQAGRGVELGIPRSV